jgi:hypothetical protein
MGLGKVLALLGAILIFVTPAAAQPVPKGVGPRATPTPLLTGLRFNTVALRATWENGNDDDGFGLIIAKRGNDVLVATAAHVVYIEGRPASVVRVTFVADDSGRTETFDGAVEAAPPPGIPQNLDLAFVSVKLNRPQPTMPQSMAATPIETGDPVWILGRVKDRDWSATPGEATPTPGDADTITFSFGDAEAGTSGSPLVAYAGVVGLVRRSGESRYATSIFAIHKQFERFFAARWQWSAYPMPIVRRLGWVRLRRADALGTRLPATIALSGAEGVFYLNPEQWIGAPAGRYTVGPWGLSGIMSDVTCDVTRLDVTAWAQRELALFCRADPTGTWDLLDGRLVRIGQPVSTRYPVTVLRLDGRAIGNGSAQVFDEVRLRLDLQDEDVGVSQIDVTLAQGTARGTISLIERGIERPIQIYRKGP